MSARYWLEMARRRSAWGVRLSKLLMAAGLLSETAIANKGN